MSTPGEDRRRDAPEIRERLARLETLSAQTGERLAELGRRSHDQGSSLTILVQQNEHIVTTLGRMERTIDANRLTAAEEHSALRRELREELAPIKSDYLDRMAIEAEDDRRSTRWQKHPLLLVTLTLATGAGAGIVGWAVWFFGWGPKPS